jgi:transcriptional regulator with XRE-family HTH domain
VAQSPRVLDPQLSVKHFFGAELRRFRVDRHLSQAGLGVATHASADMVAKIEKAERWPTRGFAARCDQALETGGVLTKLWPMIERMRDEQVAKRVPAGDRSGVPVQRGNVARGENGNSPSETDPILLVARRSLELVDRLGTTNVSPSVLEHIDDELSDVARDFLVAAPQEIFPRLVDLHEQIRHLLHGRQPPSQISRLYALCAKCCALLAYLSEDMGYHEEARSHTRTAWLSAEESRDNGALQWVRAVQCRLAYWSGRFKDSARFAADGLRRGGYADNINPLLALMEARAWASAGRPDAAQTAIEYWHDLADGGVEPQSGYTIFHITMDRQVNLLGISQLWLGRHKTALDHLQDAVKLLRQLPEDDLFTVSVPMNQVDSARAYLQNGDLDAAIAAVAPLLEQEDVKLARMVRINAGYLRAELAEHGLYQARSGSDFYEQLKTLL